MPQSQPQRASSSGGGLPNAQLYIGLAVKG